jgi:hypothetical protein
MARWILPLGLLAAFLPTSTGIADEPRAPTVRPEGAPPAATAPSDSLPGPPLDIWYLWGDDGRPIVVPDKVRVREYLEWLTRQQATHRAPAAYSISRLNCSGTAQDDRLRLSIAVQLQVIATDEWVLVPLLMAEGTLREPPVYEGSGEAVPAPYHPESGYAWWFKGKGQHELTLSLGVPIRRQPAGRRVQLSLPPTAVSSLKLRVPGGRVTRCVARRLPLVVSRHRHRLERAIPDAED